MSILNKNRQIYRNREKCGETFTIFWEIVDGKFHLASPENIYLELNDFDTVPHGLLQGVLKYYGVKGKTNDWIKILSDRGNKWLRIKGLIGTTSTENQSEVASSNCQCWAQFFLCKQTQCPTALFHIYTFLQVMLNYSLQSQETTIRNYGNKF